MVHYRKGLGYMRICIVDDDSTQLDYLKSIISRWGNKNSITTDMNFYSSSEEMLFENNGSYPYDMVILDIQMGRISGIELAKKIRETDKNVLIAFISGIADYVYEGYEVQAIRYILKPFKEEKIMELLEFAKSNKGNESKYIVISVQGERKKINYNDIIYIQSMGHYITLNLFKEEIDYKCNIGELYDELDKKEFVKTHRSYLVNLQYIERITKSECLLVDNRKVPLSRNSYKSVNSSFIEYHRCRRF